jgi:hypothetical protein
MCGGMLVVFGTCDNIPTDEKMKVCALVGHTCHAERDLSIDPMFRTRNRNPLGVIEDLDVTAFSDVVVGRPSLNCRETTTCYISHESIISREDEVCTVPHGCCHDCNSRFGVSVGFAHGYGVALPSIIFR